MTLRVTVTLDEVAQQAWMDAYNVEPEDLPEDVKTYFGNSVTGDDFKNIIGAPIVIDWK
ncbi:hypothetical protein AB0K16_22155 [Nonomuraea jabiensis]|uniref:hypothetical protein n=1 Tax=Nonomuraea jabiensis TaxID=882448 RepID=UPI0034409536